MGFGKHVDEAAGTRALTCGESFRVPPVGGIAGVERDIASVADVFALQGDARMREIEKNYLR